MIAIANDHSALTLKKEVMELLDQMDLPYVDFGTNTALSCDYPLYALKAAQAVAKGECEIGILICGTGIGVSLAANKVKGIRCALCSEPYSASMARMHNNANMLAMGARVIGPEIAKTVVRAFLETSFEGGRHQRRVEQIMAIENELLDP